ncbi:MAG: methyltransferase domain-containing protein [Pseudomonadota bacterium]|nr:methyltransferase domain-containing protein [Pseudomonadota bacterium]
MSHPVIFNRSLLARNKARAAESFQDFDFLLANALARLTDRLLDLSRSFELVLNLGGRNGMLEQIWPRELTTPRFIHTDISEKMVGKAVGYGAKVVCDEEFLPFAHNSLDAVISCLSLHWANDLPGVLKQITQSLKPDSLFLVSILGGQTLYELREVLGAAELELRAGVSPRVSPFATLQDFAHLMQRGGLALPVADTDTVVVHYNNIFELMRDLRGMGETNILIERSLTPSTKTLFLRANQIYQERFSDGKGKLKATFEILTGTAWTPHPSQQKPLRPGSAKLSLTEALKN